MNEFQLIKKKNNLKCLVTLSTVTCMVAHNRSFVNGTYIHIYARNYNSDERNCTCIILKFDSFNLYSNYKNNKSKIPLHSRQFITCVVIPFKCITNNNNKNIHLSLVE